MANPAFIYTNIKNYSLTASGGSFSTDYDISNLKSYFSDDVWESNSLNSNQTLIIDLGSIQTINTLVIDNHNFSTVISTGSIKLISADNYDFTSNSATLINNILTSNAGPYEFEFSDVSNRYFKIFYNGSMNERPYIGNIFLTNRLQFPRTYIFGYETNNGQSKSEEFVTPKGTIRTNSLDISRDIYELNFKFMKPSFRNDFLLFIKNVKGKSKPWYFKDVDNTIKYVQFMVDYSPSNIQNFDLNDIASIKFMSLLAESFVTPVIIYTGISKTDDENIVI